MKKKIIIIASILLVLIVAGFLLLTFQKKEEPFYLENEYYKTGEFLEINFDELKQRIEKKESFVAFVYQPMCVTSFNFERVLSDFLEEKQISVYKIAFADIKNTELGSQVKYYPSFLIYKNGKMIDFLEADKDEDVNCYTSLEGFERWFTNYVKLKEVSNEVKNSFKNEVEEEQEVSESVHLENVIREKNKVNIYFFWGDGCPHCEEELQFFESIQEKYGEYFNLYRFETWHHEENKKLVSIFASVMGDKLSGVPYTIIGEKSFTGFGENSKNNFIKAIESQYKNSFDVYFDKIKE